MSGANSQTDCSICDEIHRQGQESQPPKLSYAGKVVLAAGATVAAVVYGVAFPFILPGFRKVCLPFVPATDQQIKNVLTCLKGRSGSLVDLGSGDGRIVLAVMKAQHVDNNQIEISRAEGVELNSWLVLYSKLQKWRCRNNLTASRISFYKRDIFKTNLGIYDNIVVFGVESLMERLEVQLANELKDDGLVLACRFPLPNWEHVSVEGDGIDKVWVYNRNLNCTKSIAK